jgi:HNH endonuclease
MSSESWSNVLLDLIQAMSIVRPPFRPVRRCIYCLSETQLSDEHIIPMSLGGTYVLPKASCESCRAITARFEQRVTRDMYWPLRLKLGLPSSRKRKKTKPTHWRAVRVDESKGTSEDILVPIKDLPQQYIVVEMPPPGIISDLPLSESNPEMKIQLRANQSEMGKFLDAHKVANWQSEFDFDWFSFCRMLAKIGHAHSVATCGFTGIQYYLPSIILGEAHHISHFIGGVAEKVDELEPPAALHLGLRIIRGEIHVHERMTFFGNRRFPTYEVITGRITDPEAAVNSIKARTTGG